MWEVFERKSLLRLYKKLPKEVRRNYEIWKRIVELDGPRGLREIKGFHDELLRGEWFGYRSSRLSRKWRVIYKVEKNECFVYVFKIDPHKY